MQRQLVEQARDGDLDAFTQLVKLAFPRLKVVAAGSVIVHIEPRTVLVGGTPIEVPGAQVQRLTSVGANAEPRFLPDGTRIGFVSDQLGAPSLWSMRIDGSDQHELLLASIG